MPYIFTLRVNNFKGQTIRNNQGGGGGGEFSVHEFFLSPTLLQEFFSRLHEYFLRCNRLQEFFLDKVPLQEFFLGKVTPPPLPHLFLMVHT